MLFFLLRVVRVCNRYVKENETEKSNNPTTPLKVCRGKQGVCIEVCNEVFMKN